MKKILLGTTAMMTAGLVASGAQANEWKIMTGGYYSGVGIFADEDPSPNPDVDDFQIKHEGEFRINPEITLDNGLKIGADFNIELTNNNAGGDNGLDETFLYVEGSFGRVEVGEVESAAHRMHITAPYTVGSQGVDSPNMQHVRRNGTGRSASGITLSGDTIKISGYSPVFAGFQLGVSYTPEGLTQDVGGQNSLGNGAAFGLLVQKGDYEDTFEIGLTYAGDFEGVAVGVSGGFGQGDSIAVGDDDPEAWSVGLSLATAGFTLSGGYYDSENIQGQAGNTSFVNDEEETAYSVGLQYETGPWRLGVSYFEAEQETANGTKDSEFEVFEVAVNKNLGAGVDVFGIAQFYEEDDDGVGPNSARETDVYGLGIDLSF